MSDVPQQKCRAQEFYICVMDMCICHEVPICRRCGFNCIWHGDEAKCNHYEPADIELEVEEIRVEEGDAK